MPQHTTPVDHFAERTGTVRLQRGDDTLQIPTIRVVAGAELMVSYAVYPTERVVIGRDARCDLVLSDSSISRRHACITSDGKGLLLEDLGSTNGTLIGTRRLKAPTLLPLGTMFYLGSVALRVDELSVDEIHHLERLAQRLSRVTRDPLTGLLGRGWIEEELGHLATRHRRAQEPLAAIFVDVDHFKSINDTYGHATGDDVLRIVARVLNHELRDGDKVARYGGEEFVVILTGCTEADAMRVARRLRYAVERHEWEPYLGQGLSVTASFGVAAMKKDETLADWLKRADQAMYAAKQAGRNRVFGAEALARTAA
ncbi:MAG: GGDEF domain-containing protein [Myxococcota bacterium]